MHHRPSSLVGGVLLYRHAGRNLDPVPVLILAQAHTLGDQPQELHVVFAADHGEAARTVDAGVLLGVAHDEFHVDHFPRPAVRVVHDVHIPHAEIIVRDVDQVLFQIKRTLVSGEVVLAGAVLVFQVNVCPAVHHTAEPPAALPCSG